ncbi:unnamed protein product [Albugo candida]|uniref:Uncharacterized protein n=1 Tax=Albugo candida TaxID=65357 RepID=A0A024G749_9STRA|nr:unnamed protein product [Albugo candida]|eukprot:CCI42364.1 unnamed protein product [Albugo candida]
MAMGSGSHILNLDIYFVGVSFQFVVKRRERENNTQTITVDLINFDLTTVHHETEHRYQALLNLILCVCFFSLYRFHSLTNPSKSEAQKHQAYVPAGSRVGESWRNQSTLHPPRQPLHERAPNPFADSPLDGDLRLVPITRSIEVVLFALAAEHSFVAYRIPMSRWNAML